jgi:hypothetical protein
MLSRTVAIMGLACRGTFAAGLRRATGCLAGFTFFLSSVFNISSPLRSRHFR